MARVAASQVVSFRSRGVMQESIEALRAKCVAAEEAATAAVAPDSPAHAELLRTRQIFQQMLDAMSLEVLLLKRELEARDRAALPRQPENRLDAEISFDEIDALLATTPLDN
jgi:hypothetical protein